MCISRIAERLAFGSRYTTDKTKPARLLAHVINNACDGPLDTLCLNLSSFVVCKLC